MPAVLVANEERWTCEYVAAVKAGDGRPLERWRHREIKVALREELSGKCVYCEAYVEDVAYPHVEHIVPKVVRPDLAHRWANSTSACVRCNVAKGAFYDPGQGLLNPYEDGIDEHLVFFGDFVMWRVGSVRGEVTVRRLDLNRLELVHARLGRLMSVQAMVDRWYASDGALRETLAEAIRLDAAEGEFTEQVAAYLERVGFPLSP